MTQKEREAEVRKKLYKYAAYRKDIEDYESIVYDSPKHDDSGVRGTDISDPTARIAVALANPPPNMRMKYLWVNAIDDALDEMELADDGNKRGLVFIATAIYGLDGKRHKKRKNRDTAIKVAMDCELSRSALYYRLTLISSIVMYHAILHGLL